MENVNKYITIEYFLDTYNSQHRGNYTDETLQYYIDYATIRIENLVTNLIWDYNTSEGWRQQLFKYAICIMAEHWLKQGNNLTLTDLSGSVGSISFSNSTTSNVEYVPKLVLDLLIRSGAREASSFDASTEGIGPLNEYSPVFKTQQLLKDVSIEEAAGDSLILLTKDRVIELLKDAAAGEFQFATGEFLHDMNLIGDSGDAFIYKQSAVDGLLIPINADIARLFQEKANVADVYTKSAIDIQQQAQDGLIRLNTQKSNSNQAQINAIKQTIDQGGVARETFIAANAVLLNNTPIKSNSPLDLESNNPLILSHTAYPLEGLTTFDALASGKLSITIEGNTIVGNSNNVITMRVKVWRYDGENVYFETDRFLDKKFDFNAQSIYSDISDSIDITVQAGEKYFLTFETLEVGSTLNIDEGAKFIPTLYSAIGTGVIPTSDDWINTSTAIGGTGTEALDWIVTELNTKATIDFVNTQLALKADLTYIDSELALKANQTDLDALSTVVDGKADTTYVDGQLDLKANSADVYTKGEIDSLLAAKLNRTSTGAQGKVSLQMSSDNFEVILDDVNGNELSRFRIGITGSDIEPLAFYEIQETAPRSRAGIQLALLEDIPTLKSQLKAELLAELKNAQV